VGDALACLKEDDHWRATPLAGQEGAGVSVEGSVAAADSALDALIE
jgi:hypothetical protein